MNVKMPTEKDVKSTFEMLIGSPPEVQEIDEPQFNGVRQIADYWDDDDKLVASIVSDGSFATYIAASLSMMPPGVAQEQLASGELNEGLTDSLHEVMNICANLFMNDSSIHLRLHSVGLSDDDSVFTDNSVRKAFQVGIPNYGSGVVCFLSKQ